MSENRIGIGINENVVLAGAAKNQKGSLELTFRKARAEEDPNALFNMAGTAAVSAGGDSTKITIFPFKVPELKNKQLTDKEKVEWVGNDMVRFKDQLQLILEMYTTTDKITWNPFVSTGITADNFREMYLDNGALKLVYDNYVEQFLAMVEPFLEDDSKPMRLKLPRQSKDKHYPTLPSRYLSDNPFIEPMTVPKEASRVNFTKYEIEQGLANADVPTAATSADPTPDATPNDVGSVFGQR